MRTACCGRRQAGVSAAGLGHASQKAPQISFRLVKAESAASRCCCRGEDAREVSGHTSLLWCALPCWTFVDADSAVDSLKAETSCAPCQDVCCRTLEVSLVELLIQSLNAAHLGICCRPRWRTSRRGRQALKRKNRVPREGAQAAAATSSGLSLDGWHCPCAAGSSGRPDCGAGGCRKEGDKGSGSSSGGGAAGAGGGSRGAPPPGAAAGGALRGDDRPRSGEEYFVSLTRM